MAKGILVHRADSKYDDFPEERYQFPKRYLNRARQFVDDWIIYYEPRGGGGRLGYTGIAKIRSIAPDPVIPDMFIAEIEPNTFLPFEQFVSFRKDDGFMESDLRKPDGKLNGGLVQWAIRPVSDKDFAAIVGTGFPEETDLLPRADPIDEYVPLDGFSDVPEPFTYDDERTRVEQTISRIPRDRVFRKLVLEAYDSRCAITGLKLINGGGRAEVEAAHIKPVQHHGPDTIRNGLALSGTAHWMFDRGLIGLGDDLEVLISRQTNDPDQIKAMINHTGKAIPPSSPSHRPHPRYLEWHRDNCFKQ